MSRHVEKLGSVHTKCQYQVTVLGTNPVLEIGTILLHLNGYNFLIRQISLHVQRRVRVDVGHVFGVKTNPYLKIKYTFEIFHQPAVKL